LEKVVKRLIRPTMMPKTMKALMKIMAFTKLGMRSQVDSQEEFVELVQVESGMVFAVPLLFRGMTWAFVLQIDRKSMTAVWRKMPMAFERSVD
jgi:hypothetical protein